MRLGLSDKTLRKRLESGEIEGRRVAAGGRDVWRVAVPSADERRETREDSPDPSELSSLASRLSPSLSPEFDELLRRHEAACVRLGYLQAQGDRLPALEAGLGEETQKAVLAAHDANLARLEAERLQSRIRRIRAATAVLAAATAVLAALLILQPRRAILRQEAVPVHQPFSGAPLVGGGPRYAIPDTATTPSDPSVPHATRR